MVMVIEIQSWLLQPKLWRAVCFVSSIVGMVCYALSSSFNHLFGNWSWWKMLLYVVFSIIICLAVLFAKAWEWFTTLRLEAHTAFLNLMITSVYSFFVDKVIKGRPDTYSLVSCASFAIMSLGLSRLNHFGFEVDLLYFFGGLLTVQLMKIKLWLVVLGGIFNYSLIILRSTLDALLLHGDLELQAIDQDIESASLSLGNASSQMDSSQAIIIDIGNTNPQTDAALENEDTGFLVTQQPKVQRFLSFVSAVVGLICYALSSSFNDLFGNWTWWKMLLYIVFSFLIIFYLVYLFMNTWDRSVSPRLEAHSAFLVLLMTSVYSFFVDKEVKGKPDVYSLVSCAAFAIMSLGMSTLSPFGFEVDLLYFFSGVLIVQLMKIKLWLVIIGGGFSYSLIILRSTNGYTRAQDHDQDYVAIPIDSLSQSQVTSGSVSRVDSLFATDTTPVTQVASHSQGTSKRGLIRTQFVSHIEELKKENRKVIDTISKHVGKYLKANVLNEDQIPVPEMQADDNLVVDVLPPEIMDNLRKTGRLMFQNECCDVYSSCRREFLKECLSALGLQVEELNVEDIDTMEKIESWIKALNIVVRILFPNERRLCDRVFSSSYAADISFGDVCKELTISLLRFANTLATENHSPYHLSHVIPKVFKTLGDLIPKFNTLFYGQLFSESLRNDAVLVGKRLGIFVELESLIHHEAAQETVSDGGIHPITNEVIYYLRDVFTENESFSIRKGTSSFSDQVAKIIQVLDRELEAKSKSYRYPALGHVFMINNLMLLQYGEYIYGVIFGQDWYKSKINQNIEFYHRSSWNKILDLLKPDQDIRESLTATTESMKNKIKLFNTHFNEICEVQSAWFIFDEQLREQMIKSVENSLLSAYGKFLGRFHDVLGEDAYDFIEYGMQNIQDRLSLLFLVSFT